jgi:diguanylate cyclase (GGDEF)-like protein
MASGDNVLHLITADDSLNDAEHLVSVLRNAGMAVRPKLIEDDEQLEQVLADRAQDLFLCAPGLDNLPMETAFRILEQSGKDIPMLVLSEDEDAELRREVMGMGAVDMVSKADSEHFRYTIQRELRNLRARRQLRRLEAGLKESERRAQQLLNTSRDAIAYIHEGMHVYANTSYLERFGFNAMEELEGLPVLDLVTGEDQKRLKGFLRAYNKGEQEGNYVELTVQPTPADEPSSIIMYFAEATWDGEACTQIHIPEQQQAPSAGAAEASQQDEATGLYQRRQFMETLEQRIAAMLNQNAGGQVGLLYISPDNLDTVRQSIGITAVDVVVSDVAEIVANHLGTADAAGRFSDEVITVMLSGQGVHEALSLAETIRGEVEASVSEVGSRSVANACSIGVVILGDNLANTDTALNLADEACEQARRDGGNRVQLYTSAEERAGDESSDWERWLQDALEGDSVYVLYQPLVALASDQTPRYEARVRITGPEGEELGPGEFMSRADEAGLTPQIDRRVLESVVYQLAEESRRGEKTVMFMKVAGATLADSGFVDAVAQTLKHYNVSGSRLVFEVNEPVAVTQLNQAKQLFKGIKELKCGFVLDQFGSGLNPFQLLKHLPAEFVKLDRTIIEQLSSGKGDPESVQQTIATAHEMRKKVIGGYIEGAMELAQLWQYEVDLVQGNFLAGPSRELNYDFTGMVM